MKKEIQEEPKPEAVNGAGPVPKAQRSGEEEKLAPGIEID